MIEYLVQNKESKYLSIITLIFSSLALISGLAAIPFGTQYLYGSLIGILGVLSTLIVTLWLNSKLGQGASWLSFGIKIGIYGLLIATPLFTINVQQSGWDINAALAPINMWFTIAIMGSVPILSSVSTVIYQNKFIKK